MTNTVNDLTAKGFSAEVARPLLDYVQALNDLDARRQAEKISQGADYLPARYAIYTVDDAPSSAKYVRVVMTTSGQRSVHSMIVKADGRVCKAAGWKGGPVRSTAAATKGQILSKYNLTDADSFARLLDDLDPFAGYLYQ